jgi:hypothetical protein
MAAHGFLKNRSVVTNAQHHVGKNYVYNIDIKNFFPSIHKARIEKKLQLPPFNLSNEKLEIATIIARLTTQKVLEYTDSLTNKKELLHLDNKKLLELPGNKKIVENFKNNADDSFKTFAVLPQGAPTSPIISNFICDRLDRRLLGLAKRFNAKYTRYADDITFSSMHNVYQDDSEFIVEMKRIIADQNFEINSKKTRLQKRGYRQEVTGVVVNDKTNVNRRYIKQLRAMLYAIKKYGVDKAQNSFIKHYKDEKGHVKDREPNILNVLSGKLDYMKMVKGHEDATYLKLKARFDNITGKTEEPLTTSVDTTKSICINHNPKALVRILSSFTDNNNPLKYTTHSWDMGQLEDKWENFDVFIKQVSSEWKKVKDELKELKPQLAAKISSFLFRKNLGEKDSKGHLIAWGEYSVEFGWSSKELKVWSNNENDPFNFVLPEHYRKIINDNSIDRFKDIVQLFKNEIEVRSEEKRIKQIFRTIKKNKLGKEFKLKLDKSLDGIDFYTDVQHLKNGLAKIFEEIAKRTQYPQIKIEASKNISEGYIDISIIHIESFSNKESIELLAEVEDGDFSDIKKSFCSLCDWSIRDKFSDGSFQVNYLGEYENKINKIDEEIEGFTHILRFYK